MVSSATIIADLATILTDDGQDVTLKKHTVTVGPMGEVTAVAESSSTTVRALRSAVTDRDRELLEQGIARKGDIKGVYKTADDPDEGDVIVDGNSEKWRIIRVNRRIGTVGTEVFKSTIERRIEES